MPLRLKNGCVRARGLINPKDNIDILKKEIIDEVKKLNIKDNKTENNYNKPAVRKYIKF